MIFSSAATTTPAAGGGFFAEYGLLILLAALLVFMFWSSRRRTKKMKEEQEKKALQMLPGVKVLLQGGIYGTIVEYDAEDLSRPAIIELAPGVEIEVHSQAILRAVEDEPVLEDEPVVEDAPAAVPADDAPAAPVIETPAPAADATAQVDDDENKPKA